MQLRIFKQFSILIISILIASSVFANPVVSNVAAGQVSIQQTPATTTVNQSSQKAIINWQSFNIGHGEKTHFNQPAGGTALNRINPSAGASQIYGSLTATGQIILSNPAGIYFGPSAYVNVGGMIATTANVSDANFMAGIYQFSKVAPYSGAIVNEGQIIAAQHGLIALVAPGVINKGVIQANLGKVVLASGEAFTVNFAGDNMVNFAIDAKTTQRGIDKNGNPLPDGISNTGSLIANGGTILLTAKAAAGVLDHTLNMEGIAQAQSFYERKGHIILSGDPDAGIVKVAARLDASGKLPAEKGGKVEVTGYNILLDSPTRIDVSGDTGGGDIFIGGNYQGNGPLPNANAVVMANGAVLTADALTTGNGGNVILWADNVNKFYGTIYARGGETSGNGGFVETSGKIFLDAQGSVYANAPLGSAGLWLLDPANVTITNATTNGSFSGGNPNTFTTTADNATINVATINSSLNAGTSVTILTTAGGSQNGDITLDATNGAISKTAGGAATLTLTANSATGGVINLNNTITSTVGALGVTLNAAIINLSSNITSNGGAITFNAPVVASGTRTLNATGGAINFTSTLNGASDLTVNSTGTTTFGGIVGNVTPLNSVTTNAGGTTQINGGSMFASGATGIVFGDAVTLNADTNLQSSNGNIRFTTLDSGSTARSLTLTTGGAGSTIFVSSVGATNPLSDLTIIAGGDITLFNNSSAISINTNGTLGQTYNNSIRLANAAVTFSAGSGPIDFISAITTTNNSALAANTTGVTHFHSTIGAAGSQIGALTTNAGGSTILGGRIFGVRNITFNDPVTLETNITITLGTPNRDITFNDTVNGAFGLTLEPTGDIFINGLIGNITPLTTLVASHDGTHTLTVNSTGITTTGLQSYRGKVTIGNDVTLAAGSINYGGLGGTTITWTGVHSLTSTSTGTQIIGAPVSGGTGNLIFNIGSSLRIDGSSISNTGAQTYNGGTIALNNNVSLLSNNNNISISSAINNNSSGTPRNLTINAGLGDINVSGNSGLAAGAIGTLTLNNSGTSTIANTINAQSLQTDGSGTTVLNNAAITVNSGMTFNENVLVNGDSSVSAGNNSITFSNMINGLTSGAGNLSLVSTGMTILNGLVGSINSLASLAVSGNITLNTNAITTTGTQTYDGTVALSNPTALTGTTLALNNGVTGNQNLNLIGSYFILGGTLDVANLSLNTNSSDNTLSFSTMNTALTWNINSGNSGSVSGISGVGTINFTNIQNLEGGNSDDTYQVNGGTIAGSINGGGGNNTLIADSQTANELNFIGTNAGTLASVGGGFSNIQNIIGGTHGNTFNFANGAKLTGTLDGNTTASVNTINVAAYLSSVILRMSSTNGGTIDDVVNTYANITHVIANAAQNNQFYMPNNGKVNNMYITGARNGYVNDPINFNGFNTLIGSGGNNATFLTGAIYNPSTGLYTVNGVTMSLNGFNSISGFTVLGSSSSIPGVSQIIQQPMTNANQNSNSPITSTMSWLIADNSIDENITDQLTRNYEETLQQVRIIPYCDSTHFDVVGGVCFEIIVLDLDNLTQPKIFTFRVASR